MEVKKREAVFYRDASGKEPAKEWLEKLRDPNSNARVLTRIVRATEGNFGDHRSVGDGISELRIHAGPGYRIYFSVTENDEIILLLAGGDKSSQQRDIERILGKAQGKVIMAKGSKFENFLDDQLKDPKLAAHYIMAAIEENDEKYLALALSAVVKAHGTSKVAKASHLSRQALYKMFSSEGNPSLQSVNSVLGALGLRISIEPKKKRTA